MKDLSRYLQKLALLLLILVAVYPVMAEEVEVKEPALEQDLEVLRVERDPFWPVGYTPKDDAPAVASEEVKTDGWMIEGNFSEEEKKIIAEKLKLRGVMQRGKKSFAVLANRLAGVGDVLTVKVGEHAFELKLTRFDGKTVVLSPVNKNKENLPAKQKSEADKKTVRQVPTFRALP